MDKSNLNQDNYKALLDNTEDMLWSLDVNLNLTASNRQYQNYMFELFGEYPVVGNVCIVLDKKPSFCNKILEGYHIALGGTQHTLIDKGLKIGGVEPDILIRFRPIKDTMGQIIGVSCFRRDITETTCLINTLKQRNEQLEKIAWIQSHKLRGPLATIMGLADLMKQDAFIFESTERADLIIGFEDKLKELDEVIYEIVKKAERSL